MTEQARADYDALRTINQAETLRAELAARGPLAIVPNVESEEQ